MRVLVLAPYPPRTAPSQRFRFEQYLDALRTEGIDLEVRPLFGDAQAAKLYERGVVRKVAMLGGAAWRRCRSLASARQFDAVLVHREAFPAGYPWVERALGALRVPMLFDFDDAIYLPNVSEVNRRFGWLKMPAKTERIASWADCIMAGNSDLAGWASQFNDNVRVVPTTIDTSLYRPRVPTPGESPRVGWSGSRTTIQHLEPLGPVLRDVQASTGARLRVIGDPSYELAGASVEAMQWREQTELHDLSAIDIGVMPLPDEPWARGKCGLKALQYMALGIATVMSPVGVNMEIAEGGAALLASTPAEWREALTRLVEDETLRAELGDAGRRRVEERYSMTANLGRYVDALTSVSPRTA